MIRLTNLQRARFFTEEIIKSIYDANMDISTDLGRQKMDADELRSTLHEQEQTLYKVSDMLIRLERVLEAIGEQYIEKPSLTDNN